MSIIPNWLRRGAHAGAGAGDGLEKTKLTLGFIPLTDCAPLVVAREKGCSVAVSEGLGRVLITSYELWNNGPEKVFGVNLEWAEQYSSTHRSLLMALLETARWTDAPENRGQVVELIAQSCYINAPRDIVGMSMIGTFRYAIDQDPVAMRDFNCFYRFAATFPWQSHAEWFLTQMFRWGQIQSPVDIEATAAEVYRPDLYREAAAALGLAVPSIDAKVEGDHGRGWILEQASEPMAMGSDRFFDGKRFDPSDPMGYLKGFDPHRMTVDSPEPMRASSAVGQALVPVE